MTDKVAIVGAGLLGRAWAIGFARGGHRAMLFDADDKAVASALSTVEGMLRTLELIILNRLQGARKANLTPSDVQCAPTSILSPSVDSIIASSPTRKRARDEVGRDRGTSLHSSRGETRFRENQNHTLALVFKAGGRSP
jgi:hypothetical protein